MWQETPSPLAALEQQILSLPSLTVEVMEGYFFIGEADLSAKDVLANRPVLGNYCWQAAIARPDWKKEYNQLADFILETGLADVSEKHGGVSFTSEQSELFKPGYRFETIAQALSSQDSIKKMVDGYFCSDVSNELAETDPLKLNVIYKNTALAILRKKLHIPRPAVILSVPADEVSPQNGRALANLLNVGFYSVTTNQITSEPKLQVLPIFVMPEKVWQIALQHKGLFRIDRMASQDF